MQPRRGHSHCQERPKAGEVERSAPLNLGFRWEPGLPHRSVVSGSLRASGSVGLFSSGRREWRSAPVCHACLDSLSSEGCTFSSILIPQVKAGHVDRAEVRGRRSAHRKVTSRGKKEQFQSKSYSLPRLMGIFFTAM